MTTIKLGGAGGRGPGEPGKPGHAARIENGRMTIEPCGETDCETCNPTVTPDTEPHVHHESEAALWWADAFPQWKGNHA